MRDKVLTYVLMVIIRMLGQLIVNTSSYEMYSEFGMKKLEEDTRKLLTGELTLRDLDG